MTTPAATTALNPLAWLATRVPERTTVSVAVAAKILGSALALYYAYDQDRLFPGEHFPRTWAFVVVVVAVTLVSALPGRYRGRSFVAAFGAGMLLFGGANLAHRGPGVAAAICGGLAWLAVASVNRRRGTGTVWSLAGLVAGWAVTFPLALALALTIEN